MSKPEARVTYKELIYFFLPLAVTPLIIGVVHNIANGAIARLPEPEISLAVYAVVKGFSYIIRAPILVSRQAVISLVDSEVSCSRVLKMLWVIACVTTFILLLLGYTPLGGVVLRNVIGLKNEQQVTYGYYALRIICFLPIVETLRNNNQGLAIALKKTGMILPGVLARLISVILFLGWVVFSKSLSGIVAASIAWVGGIGLEGFIICSGIRKVYGFPVKAARKIPGNKKNKDITFFTFVKFILPLAVMMALARVVEPLIQAGIARGNSPTRSLAAFGVAWAILFLVAGPLMHINQGALVYIKKIGDKNWDRVLRFSHLFGLLTALIIAVIAFTPGGFLLINKVLAVSDSISSLTQHILKVFVLYPLIASFKEVYWGILMNQKKTHVIGIAKTANIAMVVLFLVIGIKILSFDAAIIGALAFVLGEAFESWYVRYSSLNDGELVVDVKSKQP